METHTLFPGGYHFLPSQHALGLCLTRQPGFDGALAHHTTPNRTAPRPTQVCLPASAQISGKPCTPATSCPPQRNAAPEYIFRKPCGQSSGPAGRVTNSTATGAPATTTAPAAALANGRGAGVRGQSGRPPPPPSTVSQVAARGQRSRRGST